MKYLLMFLVLVFMCTFCKEESRQAYRTNSMEQKLDSFERAAQRQKEMGDRTTSIRNSQLDTLFMVIELYKRENEELKNRLGCKFRVFGSGDGIMLIEDEKTDDMYQVCRKHGKLVMFKLKDSPLGFHP